MSIASERPGDKHIGTGSGSLLVYRQNLVTRITHWLWAICLFFLLLSGLQIFNARPTLYVGQQSGFDFDNSILSMTAEDTKSGPKGYTKIFGHSFDTSGWLGMSQEDGEPTPRGFPSWATIPATQDLATGRVIHFFFAWLLVVTLFVWLVSSLINAHLWQEDLAWFAGCPTASKGYSRSPAVAISAHPSLQQPAEALLRAGSPSLASAHDSDGPLYVTRHGCGCAWDRRSPWSADCTYHTLLYHGDPGCILRCTYRDGVCGRPDQRNAVNDNGLVSQHLTRGCGNIRRRLR